MERFESAAAFEVRLKGSEPKRRWSTRQWAAPLACACPHCGGALYQASFYHLEAPQGYIVEARCGTCSREAPHPRCAGCLYPLEGTAVEELVVPQPERPRGSEADRVPCLSCGGTKLRESRRCSACALRALNAARRALYASRN